MFVSGALDQTKKICKASADIFAKFGLDKTLKKLTAYLVVPATAYRNTGLGSGIPDYRMAGLEKA